MYFSFSIKNAMPLLRAVAFSPLKKLKLGACLFKALPHVDHAHYYVSSPMYAQTVKLNFSAPEKEGASAWRNIQI